MTKKIILDCDPGHDDAVAIMLAAASDKIEILGITCVAGNATLENTKLNALNQRQLNQFQLLSNYNNDIKEFIDINNIPKEKLLFPIEKPLNEILLNNFIFL